MGHAQIAPFRSSNIIDTARASTENPEGSSFDTNPFLAALLQSGEAMADFIVDQSIDTAASVNKMTHLDMQNAIRLYAEAGGVFPPATPLSGAEAPTDPGNYVGQIYVDTTGVDVYQWDGSEWTAVYEEA